MIDTHFAESTRRTVATLILVAGCLLVVLLFSGCSRQAEVSLEGYQIVRVQLDWFPEPQHGGLFQALAQGYFTEEGLEVIIESGGTNVLVTQYVATGKADIGQSASTQVMQAIANGAPIINIASYFHYLPSGLLMHASNPIDSFEDLNGTTIMGRVEALYIPYLKEKYAIDFNVIPQNFGLAQLLQDPNFIQEGYFIAEPYYLQQEGAKIKWLALKDSGYMPYGTLFANTRFLRKRPEVAQAFVRAFIRGWQEYIEGDPEPAHRLIKERNPRATDGFLHFSRDKIIEHDLATGDESEQAPYGFLSPLRFYEEIQLLEALEVVPVGKLSVDRVMTVEFLPLW